VRDEGGGVGGGGRFVTTLALVAVRLLPFTMGFAKAV